MCLLSLYCGGVCPAMSEEELCGQLEVQVRVIFVMVVQWVRPEKAFGKDLFSTRTAALSLLPCLWWSSSVSGSGSVSILYSSTSISSALSREWCSCSVRFTCTAPSPRRRHQPPGCCCWRWASACSTVDRISGQSVISALVNDLLCVPSGARTCCSMRVERLPPA